MKLIYNLIGVAKKLGYKYFSMGASTEDNGNILNEGLYNYKAGYGYGNGDVVWSMYIKSRGINI